MSSDTQSTPRWTTAMQAYYVAEGSGPTQSDPAWDMVQLVAKNLAAKSKMTRNVNEDAVIDLAEKDAFDKLGIFKFAWDNGPRHPDPAIATLWKMIHKANPLTRERDGRLEFTQKGRQHGAHGYQLQLLDRHAGLPLD
jgi:hypothetical protein